MNTQNLGTWRELAAKEITEKIWNQRYSNKARFFYVVGTLIQKEVERQLYLENLSKETGLPLL